MDSNSIKILQNVHPKQRELVTILIGRMISLGYDARVTQGQRTFAEQNDLYKKGRRGIPGEKTVTNAVGGQSNHNYGLANDITFFKNGKPDWNDLQPYQILGREAKKLGLEWGGDWKGVDMPHVQLKGMSVKECQNAHRLGGIPAVWARMDSILNGAKPTVFLPNANELLEFGDKGEEVINLQKRLVELNLLRPHEIDGQFGKITKNAVIGFQRANYLTADGIVGPGTKAKLFVNKIAPVSSPVAVNPAIQETSSATNQETTKVEISDGEVKVETSNNPPPKAKTETVTAPAKEGSTATATKATLLGITVPAFVGIVVKAVTDLISQGFISAQQIGEFVLNLIKENQKYFLLLILGIILLLTIKKLCKQITLWLQMWFAGNKDTNNVEVKPQ